MAFANADTNIAEAQAVTIFKGQINQADKEDKEAMGFSLGPNLPAAPSEATDFLTELCTAMVTPPAYRIRVQEITL